jgi:3-deoxy-manno-octulosonate cytidylyltransferase (CMP-KDO synthetase)
MHITGIIPARFESSRFPGKPLIDLKGKSMIQRVYEGASASKLLSEVIVATDDERILEHVLSFGGKVQMTSPNHTTGTDRCGEVAKDLQTDVIINIQGDEPLVDYRQIDQLCKAFEDAQVNIATLGILMKDDKLELANPNRIKIVRNTFGDALYFSRSAIPFQRTESNYPFLKHIGLYAFRKDVLMNLTALPPVSLEETESLEQLRWLYNGYSIRVVQTEIETPNIDSPEDIAEVLRFL